jgi:hypothetical protein
VRDFRIGQAASLARTSLTDPGSLPLEKRHPLESGSAPLIGYAVDLLDGIIEAVDPSEDGHAAQARTLSVLADHVSDVLDRLELVYVNETAEERRRADRAVADLDAAIDALTNAVGALDPEREEHDG